MRFATCVAALLAIGLMSIEGCGGNACEDADAHFEECGLGPNETSSECSGDAECWASCVADADCDTLTGKAISESYNECIASCTD